MRQLLQNLGNGDTSIIDVPVPAATPGTIVIASRTTLISAGTERMLVDFGRSSMLGKARRQPEKVKMVVDKVVADGLFATLDAVRSKLAQPIPLGYCNAGTVMEVGDGVRGFRPGDRIVSNGSHAEVVRVPANLCAKIPDGVSYEAAAFTVIGAIGLQGIRLLSPALGEAVAVTGVGLIGLLAVQLLIAQGCRVLAIDLDPDKLKLARSFGAETCNPAQGEDPVAAGIAFSRGRGMDAVLIAASTASSDPVVQAARMCRKRGRIVLVGTTGLELNRADFYEKELSFQVSCSYGPGRYDPDYEEGGQDYPVGFVRWTEQRNFEAILDMLANRRIDVTPLISRRIPFEQAASGYDLLTADKALLGVLLNYSDVAVKNDARSRVVRLADAPSSAGRAGVPLCGFIGAGNYASRVLIPAFRAAGARLRTIATSGGLSGAIQGRTSGFEQVSTDVGTIFSDPDINVVAIVTRHDQHAPLVCRALEAGKHVFVEKPLALTGAELGEIRAAYAEAAATGTAPGVMVGFNRRFAPHVMRMKALIDGVREPKSFIMTMNAGAIPAGHWTHDPKVGGGRVLGEACHLIDLMRFLAGAAIVSVQARRMGENSVEPIVDDKAALILGFADGSFGTIHYLANGSSRFPKERVEVFCAGRVLQLDNFRRLTGYGWPGFRKMGGWRQDKGQNACAAAFLHAVEQGAPMPIPFEELMEVAAVTIRVDEILRNQ
ncbi:bi-domain-containing oxidoreductase [Sphingomonas sp. SRS2]|uniref:bi-domain-containing oxidoreductase n=1 Tax=Sphingomonas sp. SRS2 TaxID=133190 RepID=UPI0006184A98|nr:bi-domain-containing oxidoreductase [Sphingomonas sp. SRS2]KKC25694.1 dehydrogenase [Sphingomonas sp. SRS2]